MSLLDIRVCPACGAPAGPQPVCGHCGSELAAQAELPTREEWERERPPAVPERGLSLFAPAGPEGQPAFRSEGGSEFDGRPLANWGYRACGGIIDLACTLAVAGLVSHLAAALGVGVDTGTLLLGGTLALFWLLNTVVLVAITDGKSLGKLVGDMRIVRGDGRPAGAGTGFLRDTVARLMYVVPLLFLVDYLWAAGDRRQALRDKIAGTHVLQGADYERRAWAVGLGAVVALVVAIAITNAPMAS